MKRLITIILLSISVSACTSNKVLDIKSPCVSNNDGPCGSRKPVNDWWLNKNNANS